MTRIKIKGFKIYTDNRGKLRCYHRKTGKAIDLDEHPLGSASFLAICERFKPEAKPEARTLGKLIYDYRNSPAYQALKPNTQSFYLTAFDYLKPIADTGLETFDRALIVKIRDKATVRGWHFANSVKTALSVLFSWAVERGMVATNPAKEIKKIPRPKDLERANRPWTDKERFAVLEHCPEHLRIPIALMMYIGCDPADAIAIKKEQYDGKAISYSRTKTGVMVWRPAPEALRNILRQNKNDAPTLAANSYGQPWTRSGMNSVWMKFKAEMLEQGKIGKGLTLKGLRHTSATIMAEMGFDDRYIADAHGQQTTGMAAFYSRDANRKGKMVAVTKSLNREERKRKLSSKSRKTSSGGKPQH